MPILMHNQRAIDGLKPTQGKRETYVSTVVIGLVLEVMPSGLKSWRVRYRTKGGRHGKTRIFTIGDASIIKLGQAIDKAREVLAAVQVDARDPQAERKVSAGTFDDLFSDWFERHAKIKKKTWKYDQDLYHRHVQKALGRQLTTEIKRRDVADALDVIARGSTGIVANRAQTLISSIFNWAVNEGRVESTPTFKIPKRGIEAPRERILNPDEIRVFWSGLSNGPLGLRMERILRLALLTGQRRSEIAQATKAELSLADIDATWTIPGSRTKNGVMHRVPLAPLARQQFLASVVDSATVFVFPGQRGAGADDHKSIDPHAVTRAMSRLTASLGIVDATVHDLRRTVGTNLARLGVSKDVRARILNHVDGARSVTDAVYNQHEFADEKRDALTLWENELARLTTI